LRLWRNRNIKPGVDKYRAPENFYLAPEFSKLYLNLINGFLSPYLGEREGKKEAPEKKGLAPELFLVLSAPA
jgi:hypothetical protein